MPNDGEMHYLREMTRALDSINAKTAPPVDVSEALENINAALVEVKALLVQIRDAISPPVDIGASTGKMKMTPEPPKGP